MSAEVALQSNKLGQEVGMRTNLDVLNVQQNVFSTRRDLAEAYFNYLIGVLRLKPAVGTLTEQDVEDINRQLRGLTGAGTRAASVRMTGASCGASHAHRRSPAPRCAA